MWHPETRQGQRRQGSGPGLYEQLADQWWQPRGAFAMLHWLAAARARLVPVAETPESVLVDLGCGAGLLAAHLPRHGYRHLGVDLSESALHQAVPHGVRAVLGDVGAVPLTDGCADVVVAGEILEHVHDLAGVVAQACRLLRPGGLLVLDTLADTVWCRLLAITIAERIPRLAPRGVHDPDLLVNRDRLVQECARHGVDVTLWGIRPALTDLPGWLTGRRDLVRMVPVATTAVLFQGYGRKKE